MKKEASAKNKKWLWLVIALVALLAVAGVLVAVLFGGGDQDGDAAPTSKLYWNVDKALHTENEEAKELGITTRAPESDGLYHVRLATGGELIEVLVSDAQLINYIDTLDAMGLVFDADGMVVDALDPSVFNPEIVRDFFVKRISDTSITVNSSVAMNGMDMTFDLTTIGLYDVTDTAAQPGMPGTAGLMDRVFVYGDMEGNATDIFVVNRADDAEVYWPLPGYWNSSKKETTRVPDENGVYTITFAYKGELVDLKCKSKDLVNTFDNTSNVDRCQALKFDEEGYIIGTISTQIALKAMRICDRYDVLELNGNQFYAKGYFGSTSGKEVYSTMTDDCEVYLVCDNGTVQKHIGEKTELQLGDRILCYSDLEGNAKLIYVLNRLVDSPLYFNVYPKKISQVYFETLRKPDEDGYYNFTLASNGKTKVYRTKDVKLATFLDKQDSRGVGLKLRGDIIEAVYEQESVTGHMIGGIGRYVTGQLGSILSVALANNINNPANLVMNPDVKIYNVSTDKDGTKIGSETTLRPYDEVTIFRNLTGVTEIYVTRRYVEDAKMFWNVEAKLTPDFLETSRTPDGEGYYVFTMAHEGKQVKVKTKDKEMATYIDTRSPKYVALKTKKDPNNPEELIVKYAYDARSLIKAGYYASADYFYDYLNKEEGRHYVYYLKGDEKVTGGTKVYKNSKMKTFNISDSFELIKGEKATLRKDDKVQFIVSAIDWVAHYAYITDRQIDAPLAYNQKQMYNSTTKETTRTPDANGYYVFDLAVNGEVKQYKTKDKAIASKLDSYTSAFTLKAKGDIIQGVYYAKISDEVQAMSIGRFDVTSIDGNKVTFTRNRPTSSNYGEVSERVLAKNCKIYDVSPYAEKWGGAVKLGLGDRVEAYSNKDGELCYIYIVYACTREDGPVSHCDHCDKEVWWEPYVGDNFAVDDIHYYFPAESTVKVSFGIGANEKPVIANGTSFNINSLIKAYKGVKFEGAKMGSEVTVQDTNPIADKANKQTFPSDGTNYEAMCYACGEKVVWKALTKDAVWHKMYNPNYNNEAEEEWHSHFYVPNDLSMNRTDKALITNALGSKTLATSTMCIHLNGKTIKTKGEITVEKSILNIMGNGVIDADCTGTASVANGTIYVKNSSGKLNLYGGTYKNSSSRMEASFVFDLNGQNVHTTGKLAQVYGNMDIFDYAGGGVLSTNSANGAIGGVVVVGENGVVNLHSGTITSASASPAANGAAVYVYKGGTFNMLGGALVDGAAEKGGNIAVAGTFNMKGGTISGGSATTGGNVYVYMGGKVNMTGGKIVNNKEGRNVYIGDSVFNMSGGTISTNGTANIYLIDAATFNMSGGTVTGGTAANGGNFYLQATNGKKDADGNQVYATLNMSGGKISNGTATETGGNIYLMPFGKLNQTGGTINGGNATNGANINVGSTNARLTLGGTITNGQVHIGKTNTTTLTGKVKIDDLRITDNAKIYLDNLNASAKITVTANGAFTNANEKAKDYVKCFEAAETTKVVQELEGVLYYGDPISECPACGKLTAWTDITKYGRISSSLNISHWTLSDNFTYTGDLANSIVYSNKADYTMCINLNGKTLTAGNAIDARQGTLNIFGGEFICTSESTNARSGISAISVDGTAVVNLYDDIVVRNAVSGESVVYGYAGNPIVNVHDTVELDGDVTVRSGSLTLNMQGGEVTGKVTGANLTLADGAKVAKAEIGASNKLTIETGWSGTAVVDFASYEYDSAKPGFAFVRVENIEIKGAYTGELKNAEGKTYILDGDRLKVESAIHEHSYTTVVVTAPTCTEDGYTTHSCSCGDSYKTDTVPATGHTNPTPTGVCFNCEKVLNIALYAENMTFPTDCSNSEQLCPICNEVVTWHPITNGNRGSGSMYSHWYVAEDVTYTCPDNKQDGFLYLNSATGGSVCVNFNGKTVTSNASIDLADGTMNLMGKGNFNCSCEAKQENVQLGAITLRNAADVLNIYGGTYTSTKSGKPAVYGWGSSAATINLYGNAKLVAPEGTQLIRNAGSMTVNEDSHEHADNGKGSCVCGIVMDIAIFAENMTFPTDASNSVQYCPVCQKNVTWHAITDGNRGSGSMYSHWYVAEDVTYTCPDNKEEGFSYMGTAGGKVCVHFNGKTVNSNASLDLKDGTMNLMGKGSFTSSCSAKLENVRLGAITVRAAADVLNIYGGTYTSTKEGVPAIYGWGASEATINLYGNTKLVAPEGAQEIRNGGKLTINEHRHFHSYTTVVTPPTCTEDGYTTYTCSCGDSYVGDNVPAAHTNANGDTECDVCLKNLSNPGQTGIDLGKTVQVKSAEVKDLFDGATEDVVAVCPVCGEEKTWTAWTVAKNTNIPSVDGGHYYMAEDLAKTFFGPASGTACLNLNGKTLSGANPIYAGLGTTNIIDTAGTGKVIGHRENQAKGAAIFFDSTHGTCPSGTTSVINLFGGTYTRNNVQKNASIVAIDTNGGTINMYAGAKITAEGISTSGSAYGLAVLIQGSSTNQATFNMYGGEIVGGTNLTGNGGAVCVGFSAKNKAAFNLYDGKISGGQAQYGGNIYIFNGGELNVYDGAILGGKAKSTGTNGFGGNICVRGTASDGGGILRVHGGYILGGAAYSKNSENILASAGQTVYLGDNATSTFVMTGGRIVGQVRCAQSLTAQISGCAKDLPSFTYDGVTYTSTSGLANVRFTVANLGVGAEIWADAAMEACYKYCDDCGAGNKHTLVAGPEAITANGHYVYKTGDVYTFVCKK